MTKLSNNKGFTLVELLIVIAIIAILAAVALPVYTAQIENARITVDDGTIRSAASLAQSDYLLANYTKNVQYHVWTSEVGETVNVFVSTTDSTGTPSESWYTDNTTGFSDLKIYEPVSNKYSAGSTVDSVSYVGAIALVLGNGGQVLQSDFSAMAVTGDFETLT